SGSVSGSASAVGSGRLSPIPNQRQQSNYFLPFNTSHTPHTPPDESRRHHRRTSSSLSASGVSTSPIIKPSMMSVISASVIPTSNTVQFEQETGSDHHNQQQHQHQQQQQ